MKLSMKILLMIPGKAPETRDVELANCKWTTLRALISPLIDGQYPERVRVLASMDNNPPFQILDMFVGEQSAVDGLPRNEAATTHYRRATMLGKSRHPKTSDPDYLPAVYGPAVLFEKPVWF